jgi:hypothetical protein
MDYVKQAYAISNTDKELAKRLYIEAVAEIANKNYVAKCDDAQIDLSALFGMRWFEATVDLHNWRFAADDYAKANVAFNYANFTLGINGRFIELAKQLVANELRVDGVKLKDMAKQMNFALTKTTADAI